MSRRRRSMGNFSNACLSLHHTVSHCHTLQHTATHYHTLYHTAPHFNTLQHTAPRCNTLQHTATRCNTLQHTDVTHVQAHGKISSASFSRDFSLVFLLPAGRYSQKSALYLFQIKNLVARWLFRIRTRLYSWFLRISTIAHNNSQKSARYSIYYINLPYSWLLRILICRGLGWWPNCKKIRSGFRRHHSFQ